MRNANNLLKSPIAQWWGKCKSVPDSGTGSPSKVNQFLRLVGTMTTQVSRITFAVTLLTDRTSETTTEN